MYLHGTCSYHFRCVQCGRRTQAAATRAVCTAAFEAGWPCAFIPDTPATTGKIVTMRLIVAMRLREMPTTSPLL